MHLFLVFIAIVLTFAAPAADAFSADQLELEFDVRVLTVDEKRFLQVGLAFANAYDGPLDGAWGSGSQSALERYEVRNGRSEFVTNSDVLFLALETYKFLDKDGWVRQYNSALDMSFLVPAVGFVSGDLLKLRQNGVVWELSWLLTDHWNGRSDRETSPVHYGRSLRRVLPSASADILDHLGTNCGREEPVHAL